MRIDRIKASAVAELEKEVADITAVRDRLAGTSIQSLWLADLTEFQTGWSEYAKARAASYVSTESAAKAVKKPRVVKKKA
jgi:hypothetical protein